jgi:hypothetical protein
MYKNGNIVPYNLKLTREGLKSSVLWDIILCSPLKFNDVSEERVAFIFSTED